MKNFDDNKNTDADFQKALNNYMHDLENNMEPLENSSLFNQRLFRAKRKVRIFLCNFIRRAFIYSIIFLIVCWLVGFITLNVMGL